MERNLFDHETKQKDNDYIPQPVPPPIPPAPQNDDYDSSDKM